MNELIILVPCIDIETVLDTLLTYRTNDLKITPINFKILRHPNRDSGCCKDAVNSIRPFIKSYKYALVVFDKHGSGKDEDVKKNIEETIEEELGKNGWKDKCACIVIEPELENWVWVKSDHIAHSLGWKNWKELYSWLIKEKHWTEGNPKPKDPKDAMDTVLRICQKRHSASIFKNITQNVTFESCIDTSFFKLKTVLNRWFKPN
jgi:hypothetical protein